MIYSDSYCSQNALPAMLNKCIGTWDRIIGSYSVDCPQLNGGHGPIGLYTTLSSLSSGALTPSSQSPTSTISNSSQPQGLSSTTQSPALNTPTPSSASRSANAIPPETSFPEPSSPVESLESDSVFGHSPSTSSFPTSSSAKTTSPSNSPSQALTRSSGSGLNNKQIIIIAVVITLGSVTIVWGCISWWRKAKSGNKTSPAGSYELATVPGDVAHPDRQPSYTVQRDTQQTSRQSSWTEFSMPRVPQPALLIPKAFLNRRTR